MVLNKVVLCGPSYGWSYGATGSAQRSATDTRWRNAVASLHLAIPYLLLALLGLQKELGLASTASGLDVFLLMNDDPGSPRPDSPHAGGRWVQPPVERRLPERWRCSYRAAGTRLRLLAQP